MSNEPLLEPLLRWMRLRRVIRHIPDSCTILDIGCGKKAAFLKAIAPRIKQGIGVDFKVPNEQRDNIKTIQIKLDNELPFPDESFEVVTMLAVLEHVENEQQILAEIYRVLVPGGKLILTVPSIWSQPLLEFLSYNLKVVSEAEIRDHKRYYSCQKLQETLVSKIGFQDFTHYYFQLYMNNFCTVVKREGLY